MDIHPYTKYEIARARDEERLLRGLAAYHAMRASNGNDAQASVTGEAGGRLRILDRLRRRTVAATGPSASSTA